MSSYCGRNCLFECKRERAITRTPIRPKQDTSQAKTPPRARRPPPYSHCRYLSLGTGGTLSIIHDREYERQRQRQTAIIVIPACFFGRTSVGLAEHDSRISSGGTTEQSKFPAGSTQNEGLGMGEVVADDSVSTPDSIAATGGETKGAENFGHRRSHQGAPRARRLHFFHRLHVPA